MYHYSKATEKRLYAPTVQQLKDVRKRDLEQKIQQLERTIKNRDDPYYDNPSQKWSTLPGPSCNFNKCSKIQGCGTECECYPYGWYGHRCLPKCCLRLDGSPPCDHIYKGQMVQCALPCHTFPISCQQPYFNPYHKYQGGNAVSPNYPGFQGA